MSTRVSVSVPYPNHNRVKVTIAGLRIDGEDAEWRDIDSVIVEQGASQDVLLYGTQRIVVEEVK